MNAPNPKPPDVPRRTLLRGVGAATTAGLLTVAVGGVSIAAAPAGAVTTGTAPAAGARRRPADVADRKPVLVGANPGLQLFDEEGDCTAYASVWQVDWSLRGSGDVLVLWLPDRVVVYSANEQLARWVTEGFTRHFPELDGLPWHDPTYRRQRVRVRLSLADGMRASVGAVEVRMSRVLDVRSFSTDDFPLDDVPHSLHLVLGPCERGSIAVRGRRLPGAVSLGGTPDRPSSSAFVADAEVWRREP